MAKQEYIKNIKRTVININGFVQGVGFRPFVFNLAKQYSIKGYILNDNNGVTIEAEGTDKHLNMFISDLDNKKPPLAIIYEKNYYFTDPVFFNDFSIRKSNNSGKKRANILPDIATCDDCLKELFDQDNRRHLYPFINCTNCGPRFSIVKSLPYDRNHTTMRNFKMCRPCKDEYKDPYNRRFHAQPNACFSCGPEVEYISFKDNNNLNCLNGLKGLDAFKLLIETIDKGGIVAVKGIGGFHLMCDAQNEETVKILRKRKNRIKKPFAVMFKDISMLSKYANLNDFEINILNSDKRPVVLVKYTGLLAFGVTYGLKHIGAFLPYSPIHHIIFSMIDRPLVATSGNISDEPIIIGNDEAIIKLKEVADGLLLHNRDIFSRCDDSVVKIVDSFPLIIRKSRGFAPDCINLPFKLKRNVLAVGSHLKNTFAIGFKDENKVIVSPHIGDMDNVGVIACFSKTIEDFINLYDFKPEIIISDMHPNYETTKWAKERAEKLSLNYASLQHHRAHIISCMAENNINKEDEIFGISWDGTGYGDDGTAWGGEFFTGNYLDLKRAGSFRTFKLIGGDKAIKQPQRILLGLLFEIFGSEIIGIIKNKKIIEMTGFSQDKIEVLFKIWKNDINSPTTSSCGRIFDAVAYLCGFQGEITYEGEAAMYLEDICGENKQTRELIYLEDICSKNTNTKDNSDNSDNSEYFNDFYPYKLNIVKNNDQNFVIVDWEPMILSILSDVIKIQDSLSNNYNNNSSNSSSSNNNIVNINHYTLPFNNLIASNSSDNMVNINPKNIYGSISNKFINTLVLIIRDMAIKEGKKNICLSGGVFQNSFLTYRTLKLLEKNDFKVFINKNTPSNDGGLSLGQAVYGGLI